MQIDPNYNASLASAIATSTARQQQLTSELSSGLRVASLSDDPSAVSTNVQLGSSISQLDAFVHNASSTTGRLQVTDAALGEVVSQLTSAISLATQGANGTANASNLKGFSQTAASIRDSVLALANTSYAGHYVFSGSLGQTKPFTLDTTTTPATATYAGDGVTSYLQAPGGLKLPTNLPGDGVFAATGANVLATLNQLVADLASGSSAGLAADVSGLTTALGNVSQQRLTLDASLSQLSSSSNYAQTQETQLTAVQSTLLAADVANVATSLKTAEVQHQALISVVAALNQNDLFSYLR